MGVLSRVIDAGQEYRNPLEEVEDGLFTGIGSRNAKLTQFWVLLVLASIIAAGGVMGDSTPAVIGAMIVAPLATPIYGVALATVIGSHTRPARRPAAARLRHRRQHPHRACSSAWSPSTACRST